MWPDNATNTAKASAYSNGGSASVGISANVPSMPLDELSKQLEAARDRIAQATNRARAVADLLFGAEPEGKSDGNSIRPSIFGKLGNLNDQAGVIGFTLGELERQIGRLNPLG